MAAASSAPASPVHVAVLINPEDKQLKTVAHSLLELKLEKLLSSAAPRDDARRTKKEAIDWIKQWDMDGDGIISDLEMKAAAMQHAKLQMSHKQRGGWLVFLIILAICCFAVILGLSVWANDVSQESKGESGRSDLGGFTLRKKNSNAVVKTGTALYEFQLQRVGYLPFDELSQISGIGFVWNRALHFMDVEGFQWFGSGNVSFFSPQGTTLTVLKPTDTTVTLLLQERGNPAPVIMYQGAETEVGIIQGIDQGLLALQRMGVSPITVDVFYDTFFEPYLAQAYTGVLPDMCVQQGLAWMRGNVSDIHETCAVAIMCVLLGHGVVEAGVGPQDYLNTQVTPEELAELAGSSHFSNLDFCSHDENIFDPDAEANKNRFRSLVQARIDVMPRS
eukprot:jgi/Mesvir1/18671/Mv17170-RA.1